jgi:broad specificity phosphatase PhoE
VGFLRRIFDTILKRIRMWFTCQPVTTIVLIRHAEKANNTADTPISQTGQVRAENLVNVLKDTGLSAIFVSQFQRTAQTAQPLADHLGLTLLERVITNSQQYAQDLAHEILTDYKGRNVLVVGHTNTTEDLITELGAPAIDPIAEDTYDHLYIVTVRKYALTRLLRAQQGC